MTFIGDMSRRYLGVPGITLIAGAGAFFMYQGAGSILGYSAPDRYKWVIPVTAAGLAGVTTLVIFPYLPSIIANI